MAATPKNEDDFMPTQPSTEELLLEGFLVKCSLCGDPFPLWLVSTTKVDGGPEVYTCEGCRDE